MEKVGFEVFPEGCDRGTDTISISTAMCNRTETWSNGKGFLDSTYLGMFHNHSGSSYIFKGFL